MPLTHTTAPASEPTTYSIDHDPINNVRVWDLTDRERAIYELGFLIGHAARQPEVDRLDYEADRLYVAVFHPRSAQNRRGGDALRESLPWAPSEAIALK